MLNLQKSVCIYKNYRTRKDDVGSSEMLRAIIASVKDLTKERKQNSDGVVRRRQIRTKSKQAGVQKKQSRPWRGEIIRKIAAHGYD